MERHCTDPKFDIRYIIKTKSGKTYYAEDLTDEVDFLRFSFTTKTGYRVTKLLHRDEILACSKFERNLKPGPEPAIHIIKPTYL